jgi:hypothetical protein
MKVKHLYKDFLSDKRVYNLNKGYWKRVLPKIEGFNPYQEAFSNGKLFYDGNPMMAFYVPSLNKCVRIIQEEIESEEVSIGAWTENTSIQDRPVQQLVISLELSQEAATKAKHLIEGWLLKGWDKLKVEGEIAELS